MLYIRYISQEALSELYQLNIKFIDILSGGISPEECFKELDIAGFPDIPKFFNGFLEHEDTHLELCGTLLEIGRRLCRIVGSSSYQKNFDAVMLQLQVFDGWLETAIPYRNFMKAQNKEMKQYIHKRLTMYKEINNIKKSFDS